MIIRKVSIWLSKGWYYAVYSVSLLLLPLFFNSCKTVSHRRIRQELSDTVSVKQGDIIKGVVVKDGKPFPGVEISEKALYYNMVNTTVTDENGEFTLVVTDPSNKLYIRHRGYVTQEWPINRTMYKVHMFDSMKDFEDVYYPERRSGQTVEERMKVLADRTKPHMIVTTAYGTPYKGPSEVETKDPKSSVPKQIEDEMIEKVRAYELEQEKKK